MSRADHAYTGDAEIDAMLFKWGRVIAWARDWRRGFALGIQRDRQKPGWLPSTRQRALMVRLVADMERGAPSCDPPALELIERGDD